MRGIDVAGVWFSIQIEAINTKAEGITSWSYELLMEKLHSDLSHMQIQTHAIRVTKENGNLCLFCM